jgi:DNA-binding response OmpR family regulator
MSPAPKTVMIVEDEPDVSELFAEMMRLSGLRVIKTYTSAPAMALIAEEHPDLVILDIMMPDISGLEVLRYMRSAPELASIPVVIVSAKSTAADIREGLDAGATLYLTKPVGYSDLKGAVDSLLKPS